MYAKLKDGKLEQFKGQNLKYTIKKDDTYCYIYVSNPEEKELNEAGYCKVIPTEDGLYEGNNIKYTLTDNTIVATKADSDEEASVQ